MSDTFPHILISGSHNVFAEGWNAAGVYAFSGSYKSETFTTPWYIGSAEDLRHRIQYQHIPELNRNKHKHNDPLQYSWNKHGPENFVVWCLEVCSVENLILAEQKYLDLYRPFVDEFGGFNIAKKADAPMKGRKHSVEARAKISAAQIGSKRNLGKVRSQETKDKIAAAKPQRSFTVISPDGEVISTCNVRKFCRENNLKRWNFENMIKGKLRSSQGWKLPPSP